MKKALQSRHLCTLKCRPFFDDAGTAEIIRLESAYPPRELIQAFAQLVQRPVNSPISIAMMEVGGRPGSVEVEKAVVHMICSELLRFNWPEKLHTHSSTHLQVSGSDRVLSDKFAKFDASYLLTTNQRIRSSETPA